MACCIFLTGIFMERSSAMIRIILKLSEQFSSFSGMLQAPKGNLEGHRECMQTRLQTLGGEALADYELLEMALHIALPQADTRGLARALLLRFGSFAAIIAAPRRDLLEVRGITPATVDILKVVQAAALRLARADVIDQPVLDNWDQLMNYLTAVLARERVEQCRVLFLDARNRLLADETQARGTVNHTPLYPREVVKRALEHHASGLILVHNHPSGDTTPSRDDIDMTYEVKRASAALSIALHDHVIVGNGCWLSFRREGLL